MDFLFGRYSLMVFAFIGAIIFGLAGTVEPVFLLVALLLGLMAVIGLYDYHQKKRAVLGNYPLIGRFRFLFESIRPELRQYFWESDTDELALFAQSAGNGLSTRKKHKCDTVFRVG